VLAHVAHHVVQRGHNRQVVFAGEDDYRRYLEVALNSQGPGAGGASAGGGNSRAA